MKNTESFQNILVMSLADGELNQSEIKFIGSISNQLGITDEEYTNLTTRMNTLEFIVPNNKDEVYNEMYKMTFLALADGHFSEAEENALCNFGQQGGFTHQECINIINHVYQKNKEITEELKVLNKAEYDNVLNALRKLGKTDIELATLFHEIIKSKDIELTAMKGAAKTGFLGMFKNKSALDENAQHIMYAWLWLVYCRYVKLYDIGLIMLAMNIELVKTGERTLNDLFIDIKLGEDMADSSGRLKVMNSPSQLLKNDLANEFPFN